MHMNEKQTAFILTGGAAFGAWQGGVLKSMEAHGKMVPAVFGISAGALNGAAYYQGKMDEMSFYWTHMKGSSFLQFRPKLSPFSILSGDKFREFLARVAPSEPGAERGRCHLFVGSADLNSGKLVQAHFPPGGSDGKDGSLLDNLLGSASVPGLWPPVPVKANGTHRLLVDGGIRCFTDVEPAIALGCTDFVFISIAGKDKAIHSVKGFKAWIGAVLEQVVEAQIENTLAVLKAMNGKSGGLRAWLLSPTKHIDLNGFNFHPERCAEAFRLGEKDASAFLAAPESLRVL